MMERPLPSPLHRAILHRMESLLRSLSSRAARRMIAFLFLGLTGVSSGHAGDEPSLAVSKIPAKFRGGASAVIREYSRQFDIRSPEKAFLHVRRIVTVFSKEGRDWGELSLGYDHHVTIDDLDGTLYDADGVKIRSLSKEDQTDESAIEGLYDDARVRSAELFHDTYPYTVAYNWTMKLHESLGWPEWFSRSMREPVERSTFEVSAPASMTVRTWCNRDSVHAETVTDGDRVIRRWEATMLPALPKEGAIYYEDYATHVLIAPVLFTVDDHEGSMGSWKEFGAWSEGLFAGRDRLPEAAVQAARALVKESDTPREKARKLYRFLQSRVRYVSVQLGIGGWQPFDAGYVHERGYGDCKALSNYMAALCRAVGLPAYPVLIHHGDAIEPMITGFPSNQFNHCIVCIPLPSDTIWLECTSQTIPFGHLSHTTQERGALLITPEGGIVSRTPAPEAGENLQVRTGTIRLGITGIGRVAVDERVTGDQQDVLRESLVLKTPEARRTWVVNGLPVSNPTIQQLAFPGVDEHRDTIGISMVFEAPRVATVSGSRMFLTPNLFEQAGAPPPAETLRLAPVYYSYRFRDLDSLVFIFPDGYRLEAMPGPTDIPASFGRYRCAFRISGDTALVYTRARELTNRVIPASEFEAFRQFAAKMFKADRLQVVLVKK